MNRKLILQALKAIYALMTVNSFAEFGASRILAREAITALEAELVKEEGEQA